MAIKCCKDCVSPKRHDNCHAHCPDYNTEVIMNIVTKAKAEKEKMLASIEAEMKQAAKQLNFERAAELRDILYELRDEN